MSNHLRAVYILRDYKDIINAKEGHGCFVHLHLLLDILIINHESFKCFTFQAESYIIQNHEMYMHP